MLLFLSLARSTVFRWAIPSLLYFIFGLFLIVNKC